MINSSKRASRWAGLWLAMTAVSFAVGWRLCVIARQPAHLLAIANEVGSIALSKEEFNNGELVPGNDGRGLVFFQETETGLGAYFWDAAGEKSKLLFEQKENDLGGQFEIVVWSPGDRFLACSFKSYSDPQNPTRNIVIYDGISGESVAKIPVLWVNKFIWLSSHSYAYLSPNQTWLVFEQKSDGNWVRTLVVDRFGDGKFKNLVATSPHSVAWQQDDGIWTYDFTSEVSEKIWESATNTLKSFTYEEETGNFLLNCSDENGPLSICFRPRRLWDKQGTVLSMTRNESRARYADLSEDRGVCSFTIKTGADSEPTHLVWDGTVEYYKLAGDYLYFTGTLSNGPPGIWQYNIKSKEARCLDSGLKGGFQYAKWVTPVDGIGTNADGKQMKYHVWAPVQVSPRKKYPVIIEQTHSIAFSRQQVAANGGYYFATADRLSWWAGLSDWGADVMGLYEILAKNPNIDTNRVYLFATSAESSYLSQLVSEKPDLWRGVILFNPAGLPDLSNARLSKMFIIGGRDDGNAVKQLTQYQDEAARVGVPVKLILQIGAQHVARSIATERGREQQFARFLVEN
jgi:hypothetical protein